MYPAITLEHVLKGTASAGSMVFLAKRYAVVTVDVMLNTTGKFHGSFRPHTRVRPQWYVRIDLKDATVKLVIASLMTVRA